MNLIYRTKTYCHCQLDSLLKEVMNAMSPVQIPLWGKYFWNWVCLCELGSWEPLKYLSMSPSSWKPSGKKQPSAKIQDETRLIAPHSRVFPCSEWRWEGAARVAPRSSTRWSPGRQFKGLKICHQRHRLIELQNEPKLGPSRESSG